MREAVTRVTSFIEREGYRGLLRRAHLEFTGIMDWPWARWSWRRPGPANERKIRIFAMQRSGHHAVIDWIRFQAEGRHCFLNACRLDQNPFQACSRRSSRIVGRFGEHKRLSWDQECRGRFSKKGLLLYNFEDQGFERLLMEGFEASRARWLGESSRRDDVLVLRDPFNLLASKLRWANGEQLAPDLESFPRLVGLWKEHAREFLGDTNHLPGKVVVNYNRWCGDEDYRRELATSLDLEWSDWGREIVARWGPTRWGDSFDGTRFDGRASHMNVLNRWRNYEDDAFYISLFRDEELVDLSKRVFGQLGGTEVLLSEGVGMTRVDPRRRRWIVRS